MFSTKENGYISLTSVWAFSQFNFNISAYPSMCFSFLGLSLVSLLLCQSESSLSLPYSYSVLLGIVYFFPCFLTWSHRSLLSSLSTLLPLAFPVLLRIFFPSLPIRSLPATLFGAKPVPNFNSCKPIVQKMTPHQWPDFVVPPPRASTTVFATHPLFLLACLHPCHLLPFLFCQTLHGWNGCSSKNVSTALICVSRGAEALTTGTLP